MAHKIRRRKCKHGWMLFFPDPRNAIPSSTVQSATPWGLLNPDYLPDWRIPNPEDLGVARITPKFRLPSQYSRVALVTTSQMNPLPSLITEIYRSGHSKIHRLLFVTPHLRPLPMKVHENGRSEKFFHTSGPLNLFEVYTRDTGFVYTQLRRSPSI
jgi:hypothetical protein